MAIVRRPWPWLVVVVLVCVGYWLLSEPGSRLPAAAPPDGKPPASNTKSDAKSDAKPAGPAVPVVAAEARAGDMPVYLSGLGSVTAFNTVTVKSRVDGQLVRIAFEEGQYVKEGDLLAEVDPRPFEVQLTQAEGALARDQALLKDAQLTLVRYRDLFGQHVISRQELDDQVAKAAQYEGAVKADQGVIDNAKLQLVYSRITAPIGGRAGLRLVDVGNVVHANDATGIVVITQLRPITVVFTLPEDVVPRVMQKLDGGERLSVEAYDRTGKRHIATGELLTVDNQIDQQTGTTRLKAVFENADGALFPRQFVNARLLLDVKKDAIIVPAVAIQRGPQGTFVYVVKADETVEVRPVTLGPTTGDDTAVDTGVAASERVVVDGVDKLRPGAAVRVKDENAAPGPTA